MHTLPIIIKQIRINQIVLLCRNFLDSSNGLRSFDRSPRTSGTVVNVNIIMIRPSNKMLSIISRMTFKLIKNTIIFIEITKFGSQILMNLDGLDWFNTLPQIPHFQREIITGKDVLPILNKLDIRDRRNNLGKKGFGIRIFRLFESCQVQQN